jgi:hypothetical protein
MIEPVVLLLRDSRTGTRKTVDRIAFDAELGEAVPLLRRRDLQSGIISCLDLLNEEAETQPSAQQPGDSLNLSRAEFMEELISGLIPRGGSWSH